ncbi:MAG: preprotein translocase subunit YajC [Brachymonas sp.]|nr:preprotein translocase subunit YajC [Brachymonas sp.]MBP7246295.1 preprotein translocase subunit YajC [Brachymonas sp.]MBP7724732.1 preprotein translocase subunit YajC [Brachymonas sp.]MBP7734023.1 preprotein translocase subunit YajC [Brachymonas sp.]MBP8746616.1 preprotein translocase subunit YajC [Brachymonas sp.]
MSVIKQISPMIVIFVAMFFLMIRPQMKKQKELRNLIDNVTTGDEVITNGGLMGKVSRVKDNVLELQVAKDVEVLVQKVAVAQVLPKGTIRF